MLSIRQALAIIGLAGACAAPDHGPRLVSPERALALAEAREALLVDVRLPQERADGRMPPHTAAWFPFDRHRPGGFAGAMADVVDGDRSRPIILLCEVGHRSGLAARSLEAAGFTDVLSVDEGYGAWRSRGLALVEGLDTPSPTLSLD